ncbi:aliphatic sulfonate ABC transporter substrate-binding protein [Acidihalobacter yilgarnensis]|uniref:Aliphatic sulfonate ABC transporter substrate-binding protein n=1 Tax=Acidihalobacter yilgarnensis TaxID=2819280 RepID=A0A1D8IRX4_9GAMM|nr:ABC transporter substrate-binding protein [Acidihalobacter yilgarnensis]AOU99145.1 aliphatic sulfonate ABC transporter substrate-binding protein [Acidihalobacter yilgarnensis]
MKRSKKLIATLMLALLAPVIFMSTARAEITLGISDWPGWVAWYIAQEKGYFKKYDAHVKLVWFPNYIDSVNALSAGQLDANSQALIDTLAPLEKGLPLKTILVTDNSAGNDALMVSNSIKTFADLKGKTIGLEQYSIENYLADTALHRHGMTQKDVKIVNMSTGDAAAALISGRIDGAGVWNPWINRITNSHKGHPLFTSKDAPGLIPDLVVAREAAIKAHRKDFEGMVKAWFAVVRFVHAHPEAAAKIMAPHVGLQPKEYALSLAGTRLFGAKLNREAMKPGHSPVSLYNSTPDTAKFLIKAGAISKMPEPAMFIDPSLVEHASK